MVWLVILAGAHRCYYMGGSTATGSTGNRSGYTPTGESALDILKKRYAHGEISREEFEQMKKDLLS